MPNKSKTSDVALTAASEKILTDAPDMGDMEERMARQVRLFDSLLSSIVDFAYIFDTQGRFLYINQALLDLWQMSLEDAVGKNFFELPYPRELAVLLHAQIDAVFRTAQTLKDETSYTNPAGVTGYYEYVFVPIFGPDGAVEAVAGTTRDITSRHRIEVEKAALVKALEVERARLTSLFMQSPAFIAVLRGPQHVFELVNPPYVKLVGNRDLIGKTVREAFPDIAGQGFYELLDEVYRTGIPFMGKDTPVVLQATPDAKPEQLYIDLGYQPIVEADGSVSGIFVHGVDLTERKRAEQAVEALNVRLHRAIAETHHRVKNNLQTLSGLTELSETAGADVVPASALERLKRHIGALAALHNLLTGESQDEDGMDAPSLQELLKKLLPMLQLAAGDRPIHAEAQDIHVPTRHASSFALLVNELIANAVKHGQGEIRLSVTEESADKAKSADNSDAGETKDRIRLAVCDEGPGFPADFDPEQAANTGLQLIRSLGEWDLHGEVFFENRPEGGACVGVLFPRPSLTE